MHYLLVLDRHDDVPCTDVGGRTEGDRKALLGSTGEVASAARSEMYRIAAIYRKVGLP